MAESPPRVGGGKKCVSHFAPPLTLPPQTYPRLFFLSYTHMHPFPLGRVLQTDCRMWEGRGACAGKPNGLATPGVSSRTRRHYALRAGVL